MSERWRKVPFADARSFREYLRKIDVYLKELVDLCEGHSALQTMSATAFNMQEHLGSLDKGLRAGNAGSQLLKVQWAMERRDLYRAAVCEINEWLAKRQRQGGTNIRPRTERAGRLTGQRRKSG